MDSFLLSPANTRGRRADGWQRAAFERQAPASGVALRLRQEKLTFGELFSATSALYFRGKLEYAQHFAAPDAVRVIAPGVGLVPPHYRVTRGRWAKLRTTTTRLDDEAFADGLARAVRRLDAQRVVFLGSIDPQRYLGVLAPILGERLVVPKLFLGIGSMQRGSLLRQRVRTGRALAYVSAAQAMRFGEAKRQRPRLRRDRT
ncbi:MAG: hypothetical protein AAGK22_20555 [Acidobacteriota bacterium]